MVTKKKEKKPDESKTNAKAEAADSEIKKGEQAEVNIGMIGHVDHGKCVALDSAILLNGELSDGEKILDQALHYGRATQVSESERTFEVSNLKAFSLSQAFEPVSVNASFFVQNYSGKMLEIETRRGKRIMISPQHPLLVHDGTELNWVPGKNLRVDDPIASLRQIPDQEFVRDFFPEWEKKLQQDCWIVNQNDFFSLEKKTNSFSSFEALTASELNSLRIFLKKSVSRLEKESGLFPGELSVAFKKERITERQKKAVFGIFKKNRFEKPFGVLINYRGKTQSFCEIKIGDYWSDDMLRWLAFVIAEGGFLESCVRFSQENNEILQKMKTISRELFNETPKFYPPFDYQINSKALVRFLSEKYAIKKGNARTGGIPLWVFSLPKRKIAIFLNWFFSLEGNFNKKSGQIALVQANKKNIEVISYCLKKFGIQHSIHPTTKYAANTKKKKKRTYWQLLISNKKNAKRFQQDIGVSIPAKAAILQSMLSHEPSGKKSDEMVPLSFAIFSELVQLLGWKKKNYSKKTKKLESQPWFWAYQDCRSKNAISMEKLEEFLQACGNRIKGLSASALQLDNFKQAMAEIGLSQQELGQILGVSQKVSYRMLKHPVTEKEKQSLKKAIITKTKENIEKAKIILEKIKQNSPKNIEWDKIKKIREIDYQGPIIDLQVPGYKNFITGIGAIVSHNTSLTKALTGKWTDTHSEELKRGISIRLGYADTTFFKCEHCKGSEAFTTKAVCPNCGKKAKKLRRVSFVDAPGHETLMTTMLSGAALMNGAILVIAANETVPQPRTIEHLMALKAAGMEHIVVAQNKVDLVEKKQAIENAGQIASFLKENGFESAPIIPTVANFGTNIDLLIEAIEKNIPTPKFEEDKALKLFVARSFDVNKPGAFPEQLVGAVLGGSIIQGTAKLGDEIEISPGFEEKPLRTKIASLNTENGSLEKAKPGGLIAIGTLLDPQLSRNDQMKGQVIGKPGTLQNPTKKIVLKYSVFKRLLEDSSNEIRTNDIIVLTIGTNTVVGTVAKATKDALEIVLKNAVVVEQGQKIAISKKQKTGWRLAAYGTAS